MRINNNLMALNTHRQMGVVNANQTKSMEKLSSGLRINRAGDDAAGLAISEKMRAQVRGLNQASRNAQDGISMVQTAEGALQETQDILQRMRELAVQGSNDTLTSDDRTAIQDEMTQLTSEIDRIGNSTEFNNKTLLNGFLEGTGGDASVSASSAAVFRGTKGSLTGVDVKAVNGSDVDFSKTDAIVVDGKKIDLEWSKLLSSEDQTTLKTDFSGTNMTAQQSANVRDILENAINTAIDNSGTGVGHIEMTDATAGTFKIESRTKGTSSTVELYMGDGAAATAKLSDGTAVAGTNSVLANFLGADAEMAAAVTTTDGDWKTNVATTAGDTFTLEYAGQQMQITMTGTAANSSLSTLATEFQTVIKTAVDAQNTAAGKSAGDEGFLEQVLVKVTDDGRLSFEAPSGEIKLTEDDNETVLDDQGLSDTAIEASGQGAISFQIGANKGQSLSVSISDMRSSALGVGGLNVSTSAASTAAIDTIDDALKSVSKERGNLGSIQNRLEHSIKNLDTSAENLQAAESRIRDVDMAKEMMSFTKSNILAQAAQSMLAQANQAPQGVLSLLR